MSSSPRQQVPVFAVVGRVNMGKSAVIATLLEIDDNELVRVSPTPGETTRCQPHRVVFGDRECVRFIDTPGFSRPIEAMRAIQRIHGTGTPGLEALRTFVAEAGEEFGD
jgi:GTP-binding protein EngB required for normal cell division